VSLRLVYLARLREAFGSSGETVQPPQTVTDVGALVEWLRSRGGAFAAELAPGRAFRVAVNQEMATAATVVASGDEVAIFPPVTGG